MCKADPQLRAWRFHAVEQLGRIVEMVAVEERRRKQPEPRFHLLRDGLGEQDDIVRGFVTDPVPQYAVAGIVVIAREQPPAAGIALHARGRSEERRVGKECVITWWFWWSTYT